MENIRIGTAILVGIEVVLVILALSLHIQGVKFPLIGWISFIAFAVMIWILFFKYKT